MSIIVESLEEFPAIVGQHIGYSEYVTVTQEQVNTFADATGDHQWIHVDVERAKAGPFGGPIAHGYLTLSLIPVLLGNIGMQVKGVQMGVNYGANKIRFPAPVPVGSEVRAGAKILSVDLFEGGAQACLEVTIEVRGAVKPSCVAEILFRYYQ
ncbi:MAG: MaoC family dehydratase [Actinomycetota bacterium]|jgi:hypothetical protein